MTVVVMAVKTVVAMVVQSVYLVFFKIICACSVRMYTDNW
jgi:hypothetical protein